MPSPICTVKDGPGAPQATTNGVDVTAGNTITVTLNDATGVRSFNLTVAGQDDNVVVPTLTQASPTAYTFTAPALPWSLVLRSTVNGGLDPFTQLPSPSLTTTFKVCCKTAGGLRLGASNETVENNATTGWLTLINNAIRNSGGGGSVTWANDLAGSTSTNQYVVAITGAAGAGSSVALGAAASAFALTFAAAVTAPSLTQAINTAGAGVAMAVTAQAAKVGSAAAGGNLNLSGGAGDGAGLPGQVSLFTGATEQWRATSSALVNVQANPLRFGTSQMGANAVTGGAFTGNGLIQLGAASGLTPVISANDGGATGGLTIPLLAYYVNATGAHYLLNVGDDSAHPGTNITTVNVGANTVQLVSAVQTVIANASANQVHFSPSAAAFAVPISGSSTDNKPYQLQSVSVPSAAANPLSAAQYACPIIYITGNTTGTITFPAQANAFWIIVNQGTGVQTLKVGTGATTLSVAANKTQMCSNDGANAMIAIGGNI